MKTANLAIVFTDIKGFTERTSRQTLEENQRLLQVHEALLAPLFKAFGGRIVKSIGDAYLVTFESPTQAVLSGIAIQDRLWHHNRAVEAPEQLHVRVAINVGEVRLDGNDIFGEPVNIAARVEGIAEAGEVYFTEAVYLSMNKAEVPSKEVGAFELKGIPGKIRVFHVPRAPYRVEAPSAAAIAEAPGAETMPPFGNLALSRVAEAAAAPSGAAVDLSELGQRAAAGAAVISQRAAAQASVLGQQAAVLGRQARTVGGSLFSRGVAALPPKVQRHRAWVGVGVVVLLAGVAMLAFGGDETVRAIKAVERAPEEERAALAKDVRTLIMKEEEAGRRNFLLGRLTEATGKPDDALKVYATAVKAGSRAAEDRLIEMLSHGRCDVRSDAASTVSRLQLQRAVSALEDLQEDGGPDDGSRTGLFGLSKCDSKQAAESALKGFKGR
ncbi:adenylate/guanylate cyclase domain-containing protein [Corallococcus macrosporus]|uniref:Cyclase n=1 Tax=Corallococcus macrosporus DSM 14697 TaxID=1189310 RepID=A0A250JYC6_9BACT|nr:adenylate/guanylate cyclase domain-containing protein [Corallococcus macrosporus]ATB48472.1 cyclase [Corallococcus macrosporus DSM 14697]